MNLRDEFEKLFVHKGESCADPPDKWAWTIRGSFPIEVWAWLEQKLAEAQAETVERCAQGIEEGIKVLLVSGASTTSGRVGVRPVAQDRQDLAAKIRALSPDPHARERWEKEAIERLRGRLCEKCRSLT